MAPVKVCRLGAGEGRRPAERRASLASLASSSSSSCASSGRRSSRRSATSARATGKGRNRAQAGFIVDEARVVEDETTQVLFFGDEGTKTKTGEKKGHRERRGKAAASASETDEADFDFEEAKAKLLEERRQLEEILERIDEHERILRGGGIEEAGAGTARRGGGKKAAKEGGSSVSFALSSSSPALTRRDRYRTSLQRQDAAKAKAAADAETEPQRKTKRQGRGRKKKSRSDGRDMEFSPDFVSKSSEESLSVASTSSSSDAVTTLLQERRHLSLLSREEEAKLISQAQFCFVVEDAIQDILRDQGSSRVPSSDQIAAAINQASPSQEKPLSAGKLKQKHAEAMEARRFMLDHNVRLVVHLAHRYRGKGVSLGDLVQEGIQGLLTAIEKFDLSRNLKFSTYATWWVKQSLIRGICNYSRDVRLPVHITDTFQKMNKIQREAGGKDKVKYSVEELADLMDCRVSKIQNVLESTRTAISLEVLCGTSANSSSSDAKPLDLMSSGQSNASGNIEDALTVSQFDDVGDTLDSEIYEKILQDDVDSVLKMLPARERNILRMRFGLTPIDDMCLSLVDIGAAYGLTRERVRQMEGRALNKLRQPKLSAKLKKYVESPETED